MSICDLNASPVEVNDPIWYGGYAHRVTAVYPDGHVRVVADRPGALTAFTGYTHAKFVTRRDTKGS